MTSANEAALTQTPPMGWNSWNSYNCDVTEDDIRDAADLLVETGLKDAGYEYLVIDDCWMDTTLDEDGGFKPHPEDFPSGISPLAEYVHDRGLKFGIYSSAGTVTCQGYEHGYPGSLEHERKHAEQFAEWGVDYFKYDNCGGHGDFGGHHGKDAITRYEAMGDALRAVDRDIVYSVCEWGYNDPWLWGRNVGGHLWRTTDDMVAKWTADDDEFGLGIVDVVDLTAELEIAGYQGPGGWNDPDILQVGNGPESGQSQLEDVEVTEEFTEHEQRAHFSLWCLFGAPLMASNDLREMDETILEILTNEEAIAVDQDPLGIQGTRDRVYGDREVWSKRLAGDECAVILFNRDETASLTIDTHIDEIDIANTAGRYQVRDLWTGEEWETAGTIEDEVAPHGVTMVRVTPE